MKFPYDNLVPRGLKENLEFRRRVIQEAGGDRATAEELYIMCSRDPMFYVDTFIWTYDPRKSGQRVVPMILYDFQIDPFIDVLKAITHGHDLLIEKSRDMGATWLCLLAFEWFYHFREFTTFLCMSRKEDLVDKTDDPDALFSKLDFVYKNQPGWLRPQMNRTSLHFYNLNTSSTMDGSSTTSDTARGGRRTAILLDEFASVPDGYAVMQSTSQTTNCRIFNSTPKGAGNAFAALAKKPDIVRFRLHWSQHPDKKLGLYTSKDGTLEQLDRTYPFPLDYPFIRDGKVRSPWYDEQCRRAAHPAEIAAELDIDYQASDFLFFDSLVLDRLIVKDTMAPFLKGDLIFDDQDCTFKEFHRNPEGYLELWAFPDVNDVWPTDIVFGVGADIAAGTGASNSTLSILNLKTGEKIGAYANPHTPPEQFAKLTVALCRWFNNAFLIWEANGHGRPYGRTVLDAGYRNIYYKQDEQAAYRKSSTVPGWYTTLGSKLLLLTDYRKALKDGQFVNRQQVALDECRQYVFRPGGQLVHVASENAIDPSGAGDNHADRVIADALVCRAAKQPRSTVKQEKFIPEHCFAKRREQHVAVLREKEDQW